MSAWAHNFEQVSESLLPPKVRLWARVIGLPKALYICEKLGGRRLWIPLPNSVSGTELERLIGHDDALAFAQEFGRQERQLIEVPKVDGPLRQVRDIEIRRLHFDDGITYDRLAGMFGLSRRWIIEICKTEPEASQLPLWEAS